MDGYASDIFDLSNLPGHLAYILIAVSYYMTSIYWLRVVAVAGLFLEILYFRLSGDNMTTGIAWDAVFILINLYQLFWLVRDRLSLSLPEQDAPLLRDSLSGLDDAQIARLLKAAEWKSFNPGDILTRQDAPLDSLFYLLSGRASVVVNASLITHLERGSFIGEIAYLTGNPATATVTIEEPSRALSFNRVRMAKVIASDETISGIVYQLLGRDLAMKMRRANTRRVLLDEPTGV
jgi:CRP-like cAMP-binding protein